MATRKEIRESIKEARQIDEEIGAAEEAYEFEKLYIRNAEQILAIARDTTPFVIEGAIPSEGICFLAGRPGSKKSWVAYDAALAVSRGRPWLGFPTNKKGVVLVLNYDNPSYEIARRFKRLGMEPTDEIYFHSIGTTLPPKGYPAILKMPESMEPLSAIISRLQPDLIIIDSFRQSHTAEERSSSDMSRVISCLHEMRGFGSAVLVIHHLRKQSVGPKGKKEKDEEPLRGSTEIEASADVIMITQDGVLELTKTRGWEPEETSCDYQVEDEGDLTFVRSTQQMEVLLAVLEQKGPIQRRDLRKELNLNAQTAIKLIDKALALGVIKKKRVINRKRGIDQWIIELVKRKGEG